MVVLLFARNWKSAHAHATTEHIPWNQRVFVCRPEQLRGIGTRGVERRFYGAWEEHPRARELADALFTADMCTPAVEAD